MPVSSWILPFILESERRARRVSEELEAAAILCVSEGERKKSGFLSGKEEMLVSISKLHYPLWGIPHKDRCFLIDGMSALTSAIRYPKPPDVESFIEHLKRNATVQELYQSTLEGHKETFSKFSSEVEISIDGFITDEELLSDVLAYFQQSQTQRKTVKTSSNQLPSHLVPVIDEATATDVGLKIVTQCNRLQSDIESFKIAVKTMNDETARHVGKMEQETEEVQETYRQRISDARAHANEQKEKLEKELDEKLQKISRTHEQEMKLQLSEKRKLSRQLLKLEESRAECERRKKLRKMKKDEVGETRWDTRLHNIRSQISLEKGKLKASSRLIARMNKEIDRTTKRLRYEYRKQAEEEDRKVGELENTLTKEIGKRQAAMSELQKQTQTIVDKIRGLEEIDKQEISRLERATLPWKTEGYTLLYVPFYAIQYSTDKNERLSFYFPVSTQVSVGLGGKIRKAISRSNLHTRMMRILRPRFKALKSALIKLEAKSEKWKPLREQIETLKTTKNLLQSTQFKQSVRRGVEDLVKEGVIRDKEKTTLLKHI